MGLLAQFMQEYDDMCYKTCSKEPTDDIFQEIKQIEKILNTPKLHVGAEIKQYYKQLREQYKNPLCVQLVGDSHLHIVLFLHTLFQDCLIPLHNGLIQKKLFVRYCQHSFTKVHLKSGEAVLNLHAQDFSNAFLEEIESIEIFLNAPILANCFFVKEASTTKKLQNALKDSNCIIWILNNIDKAKKQDLHKLIKKKPTIAILAHDTKDGNKKEVAKKEVEEHEVLEQISSQRKQLSAEYSLHALYDMDIYSFMEINRLPEKCMLYKQLGTLYKQQTTKLRTQENIIAALEQTKAHIESFYTQKDSTKEHIDSIQNSIIQDMQESLQTALKLAKAKKANTILKNAYEKNKSIEKQYKAIVEHYKKLDSKYHKASETLVAKTKQLLLDYNNEIFIHIAKAMKKYLDGLVLCILDNIETIKIKTRPNEPSFLDILTNRRIIYESFELHGEELLREIQDPHSLATRRHKNLLVRLSRLDSMLTHNTRAMMESFCNVLHGWIAEGHSLMLHKKTAMSMDMYLYLESFQFELFDSFTKNHEMLIGEFLREASSFLSVLRACLAGFKTHLPSQVILRIERKFHTDKAHIKQGAKIDSINKDFISNCIIESLPNEISQIFCTLPTAHTQSFADIESSATPYSLLPEKLIAATKENEKIVRERMKEAMELVRILKNLRIPQTTTQTINAT